MKWHVRIVVIITVLSCMLCMMPLSAFAVDPEVIEVGEQAGALIFDIYGAANNTSLAYDSIQAGPALTEIITLYQEAQAEVGGDPVSMTALGTALLTAGAVAVVYDATNQVYNLVLDLDYDNFGEFYHDFNQGWDFILSDIANFVRDNATDFYNWITDNNGDVIPVEIFHGIDTSINGYDVHYLPVQYNATSYYAGSSSDVFEFAAARSNGTYGVIYFASFSPGRSYTFYQNGQEPATSTMNKSQTVSGVTLYFGYRSSWNPTTTANYLTPDFVNQLSYSDLDYPLTNLFHYDSNSTIITNNSGIDIYPSTYIGDPLLNPLEITIPDPATPMPQNAPLHIGTNIEVDPEMLPESVPANPIPGVAYPITDPAALNDIIPDAWAQTVAGIEVDPDADFDTGDTPSDPGDVSEVYVPFLPITLPSFNFHLSNIWHYVREWVASISSWFTLMFQIWSQLPYAIVVPVYATAVIVIVLGMYKRFFM